MQMDPKVLNEVTNLLAGDNELADKSLLGLKKENIERAVECMGDGGVILFYSQLTYGFATCAYRREGIEKIYRIKNRGRNDPLSVITNKAEWDSWGTVKEEHRDLVESLIEEYWPGGMGFVLNKLIEDGAPAIPSFTTSGKGSVNLLCMDEIAENLSKLADFPIACTSANISGESPVTHPVEGVQKFGKDVDMMMLGPKSEVKTNTTIIDFTGEEFEILREGAVPSEELIHRLSGDWRMV